VEAVREKEEGVLKIDGIPEFQDSAPRASTQLQVSILLYVIQLLTKLHSVLRLLMYFTYNFNRPAIFEVIYVFHS
jgi:hypothetical protein